MDTGLDGFDICSRRAMYGSNEPSPGKPRMLRSRIVEQLLDPLSLILLGSAALSLAFSVLEGDMSLLNFVDPIAIVAILAINSAIWIFQERGAEKALESLKKYIPHMARVLRDSTWKITEASDLVPGDIIEVSAGMRIPADCRILSHGGFKSILIDQSILTGESASVRKYPCSVSADATISEQANMLFSGTTVAYGSAIAMVVNTGDRTEVGKIQKSIVSPLDAPTPIKKYIDVLSVSIAKCILGACAILLVFGVYNSCKGGTGKSVFREMLGHSKVSGALAVAAIPEGLPVVISICMALGARRIARKNAIIRHLPSVETLGCVTTICTDKTGTLTTNVMEVCKVCVVHNEGGELCEYLDEKVASASQSSVLRRFGSLTGAAFGQICQICVLCNQSRTFFDSNTQVFKEIGEPTEIALRSMAERTFGTDAQSYSQAIEAGTKILTVNDFDRSNKLMSVYCRRESDGSNMLYAKGSPESIICRCSTVMLEGCDQIVEMSSEMRGRLLAKASEYGRDSLRVLGFAFHEVPPQPGIDGRCSCEAGMTFAGLVAIQNPIRPGILDAIRRCRESNVRVIVVTGDSKETAESVCEKIGLFDGHAGEIDRISVLGRDYYAMAEARKKELLSTIVLLSRAEPIHKEALVERLQRDGEVVAMTGDGVNDVPALKRADIGVAMGRGADVAKFASDMVLVDDNFYTIISAIEEGRVIYTNTRLFIGYLLSSNFGEVICVFLANILGIPDLFHPVQLLWINLITDGFPAIALFFNPAAEDVAKCGPRRRRYPLITAWSLLRYIVVGMYVGLATVGGCMWWCLYCSKGPGLSFGDLVSISSLGPEYAPRARAVSISIVVLLEMLNALNSLTDAPGLHQISLKRYPHMLIAISISMLLHVLALSSASLSSILRASPLSPSEWTAVVLFSIPIVFIGEMMKIPLRRDARMRKLKTD